MSNHDSLHGDPSGSVAPHRDPVRFDDVIESVGPDSMLVVIARWMGASLRLRHTAEDVWQEVLVHAWRDGDSHAWHGVKAYRSWLLSIAKNRIHDLADRDGANKRGVANTAPISDLMGSTEGTFSAVLPGRSTTPSRVAFHRERAQRMERALADLAPELEPIVRRHLFEEVPMREIAADLGVPESTAWSRFRKGASAYAQRLAHLDVEARASRG